jgi:Molybdopterin-binding domain of aldehyde dehydrogenase
LIGGIANAGIVSGSVGIAVTGAHGVRVFDAGVIVGTGGTAVALRAAANTFTLEAGYSITGLVIGSGGNTFQLGGTGAATFNLSSIGSGAQYRGFTTLNVVGGTWTVSGAGSGWNVNGGALALPSQIMGGIAQGLGQVLMEDKSYDETGQVLTGSFMDYAMPQADVFCTVAIEDNPVPTPTNPLGVKGAGEAGTVGSLSAGVNAIVDALSVLGIKHIDTPCTAYRVWQSIQHARTRDVKSNSPKRF